MFYTLYTPFAGAVLGRMLMLCAPEHHVDLRVYQKGNLHPQMTVDWSTVQAAVLQHDPQYPWIRWVENGLGSPIDLIALSLNKSHQSKCERYGAARCIVPFASFSNEL